MWGGGIFFFFFRGRRNLNSLRCKGIALYCRNLRDSDSGESTLTHSQTVPGFTAGERGRKGNWLSRCCSQGRLTTHKSLSPTQALLTTEKVPKQRKHQRASPQTRVRETPEGTVRTKRGSPRMPTVSSPSLWPLHGTHPTPCPPATLSLSHACRPRQ